MVAVIITIIIITTIIIIIQEDEEYVFPRGDSLDPGFSLTLSSLLNEAFP